MNIAICDDIPVQLDFLESAICNCSIFNGESLLIDRFCDGSSLLSTVVSGKSYYLIFLDIEMPNVSGLDIYSQLANSSTSLIFVSAYTNFLPETHALHAPGFLVKPYTQDTFDRTVKSVMLQRLETKFFTYYDVYRKKQTMPCRRIIHFTVKDHYLYAHTESGKVSVYGISLKETEKQLSDYGFYRCNKSNLVNLWHCSGRKDNFVVFKSYEMDEKIRISRRKLREYDELSLVHMWR